MAEINERKLETNVETGETNLDLSDKSIIKINSTSYNVYDNWFDFIRKYFGIDDMESPLINTLKASFFGYFNEIASSEIKNAVWHRNFLYDEHFLNTAVLPESIYNFAKMYNVPIENAIPASMYITLVFNESELVKNALLQEIEPDSITNANANTLKVYNLKFDRDTQFSVSNFNFMLPYPLIITIQEISSTEDTENITYSFSAHYDINNNKFPILEDQGLNPYLKVWRETVNGIDQLFIICQIFQLDYSRKEFVITTTSDNPESLFHNVEFDNQIAYFESFYEISGEMNRLNLYFNNIYTPSEEEYYGYYTYLNEQMIQISFSSNRNSFQPIQGATLYVDCYTTKGYEGNFEYEGNVSVIFKNKSNYSNLNIICTTASPNSINGKDKLDTIGQKIKVLEAITTRNNIITNNDLQRFFDSINESLNINGSKILFLKKQDDVIKRIYCNFLLLRDENRRIIPTNTAPHLRIPENMIDIPDNTRENLKVIKEHSIVTCNYIRNISEFVKTSDTETLDKFEKYFNYNDNERLSQDYIEYELNNSYFEDKINEIKDTLVDESQTSDYNYINSLMKILEVEPDQLVYTIPFLISIQTEPFLKATYYNVDINNDYTINYEYLNNKVGASFNISKLDIVKDIKPSANNKYTLDSNIYKLSFNLNTNLPYNTLKEKVIIKCNVYDENCENYYGFFFFKMDDVTTDTANNIVQFNYKYTAELTTDYKFYNNNLNLYNSLYVYDKRTDNVWLTRDSYVGEKLTFKIGILYYDEKLAASQTDMERGDFNTKLPSDYFNPIDWENLKNEIIADTDNVSFEVLNNNSNIFKQNTIDLNDYSHLENSPKSIYNHQDPIMMIPIGVTDFTETFDDIFDNNYPYGQIIQINNLKLNNYHKLNIILKDDNLISDTEKPSLTTNGKIKLLLRNIEMNQEFYNFELIYSFNYVGDEDSDNTNNINTIRNGNTLTITIPDIIGDSLESIYQINKTEIDPNNSVSVYRRDNIDYIGTLFHQYILKIIENSEYIDVSIGIILNEYEIESSNEETSLPIINELSFKLTDYNIATEEANKENINNYVIAAILKNNDTLRLYQNMSSLMDSVVTIEKDENGNNIYDLELVPMIGLRYYMQRSKIVYNIINQFINVIDNNLPRLEENTNCDLKFYNTYGPSRYFYFTKKTITDTKMINNETLNEVDPTTISNFNPYEYSVITNNNTQYNFLGRTDVILDFEIYLYEDITSEKDNEIKKYISDYIEECNTELILPISNLIMLLQNNFKIIKFIKYNGIFSDMMDNYNTSKGNDYQLIDNDFDFNKMTKDEIRVYVPEYLNLKKDIVTNTSISNVNFSTYDYVIKITYK